MGIIDRSMRDANKKSLRAIKPVYTLPRLKETITEIADWSWPKGASRSAEKAVEKSFVAYIAWAARLQRYQPTDGKLVRFKEHLLSTLPNPQQFIVEYFDKLFHTVARRRNFTGNLMSYVWGPESRALDEYGADVSVHWSGNTILWDRLVQDMKRKEAHAD